MVGVLYGGKVRGSRSRRPRYGGWAICCERPWKGWPNWWYVGLKICTGAAACCSGVATIEGWGSDGIFSARFVPLNLRGACFDR